MEWPWVSREAYRVLANHALTTEVQLSAERLRLTDVVSAARKEREDAQKRYEALVSEVVTMRKEGFVAQPKGPDKPAAPQFPPVIAKALADRSRPNSRERAAMEQAARDLIAGGKTPEAVAEMILVGDNPDL